MAPEQFRGAATPSSDLYSLGATLLYLVSGQPPGAFPQKRMRLVYEDKVSMGPQLKELLDGLLEPQVSSCQRRWSNMALTGGSRVSPHGLSSVLPVRIVAGHEKLLGTVTQHPVGQPCPQVEDRLTVQEAVDVATGRAAVKRKRAAKLEKRRQQQQNTAGDGGTLVRMPDGSVYS